MEPDIKQFLTTGYTHVPMRVEQYLSRIIPVFISMVEDRNQPQWRYDFDRDNEPDTGFYRKQADRQRKDGTFSDHKTTLHYRKGLQRRLEWDGFVLTDDQRLMLYALDQLYDHCLSGAVEFAARLQAQLPGTHLAERMLASRENVVRLLAYTAVNPGTDGIIGKNHRDKNAITLALHESCPGLQGSISEAGPFTRVSSGPEHAVAFPSMKLETLAHRHGLSVPSFWHHITGAPAGSGTKVIRYSVIFFSQLDGVHIDEDKTHSSKGVAGNVPQMHLPLAGPT